MAAELAGASFTSFSTQGDLSERFELHLGVDGSFRLAQHQSHIGMPPLATDAFGTGWTSTPSSSTPTGSGTSVVGRRLSARPTAGRPSRKGSPTYVAFGERGDPA